MATERTPLILDSPIHLDAKLFQKIANRIETIAPIETNTKSALTVKQGYQGRGTLIELNAKEVKATVCINGNPVEVILYTKQD
ncbi:MAG: hypothetical protein EB127_04510 [Alphaproteobacteria bacterium]|nr:hypothetical protein [Alphaproteobacteria bacterium]